jgi:hypothetical protein
MKINLLQRKRERKKEREVLVLCANKDGKQTNKLKIKNKVMYEVQ